MKRENDKFNEFYNIFDSYGKQVLGMELSKFNDIDNEKIEAIWNGFDGRVIIPKTLKDLNMELLISPENEVFLVYGDYTEILLSKGYKKYYFYEGMPTIFDARFDVNGQTAIVYIVSDPYVNTEQKIFINITAHNALKRMNQNDITKNIYRGLKQDKQEIQRRKGRN